MADPLRSAMSSVTPDDTSLAVPSDNRLRTGQQRVLDQVHTIKRSKSKLTKNGSPTSPLSPQVFSEFGSFKFSPAITNGINRSATLNHKSSSGFSKSVSAQKTRSQSTKTVKSRTLTRSGQWDQISPTALQQPPNGLKPSRSEPVIAPPLGPAPQMRATGQAVQTQQANRQQSNRYSLHSVTSNNVQTTSTNSIGRMVRKASTQSESKGSLIKAVKTEQEQSSPPELHSSPTGGATSRSHRAVIRRKWATCQPSYDSSTMSNGTLTPPFPPAVGFYYTTTTQYYTKLN